MDDEARRKAHREAYRRWYYSENGVAYRASEEAKRKDKEKKKRYLATERGRQKRAEIDRRHNQTDKRRAFRRTQDKRRIYIGGIYRFMAPSVEFAQQVKKHIRKRREEFRAAQSCNAVPQIGTKPEA